MTLKSHRKERPIVLGQHTAVSIARESGKWKEIPFLMENDGMMPPSMVVVGDRRRVLSAAKLLKDPILLHEAVERLAGPSGSGRVNIAVGLFEHGGKPLPVTILETQMGCSAQDINAWEVLANSREGGYTVFGILFPASGLNVIRAGTCGGIILSSANAARSEAPVIEIGDVINATASLGDGAVVRQRLGCGNCLDAEDLRRFRKLWYVRGHGFTPDNKWPVISSSPDVVDALARACAELGLTTHTGANFTKESLYLESDEERVKSLRTGYGVLSTEMEHFGLAFLAHELIRFGIATHQGLISTVVGTVPGGSFAAPGSKEEEKAKESEHKMLEATMRALWKLAYQQ
jgi:uridine phosphorylase